MYKGLRKIISALTLLLVMQNAFSGGERIGVIYPDLREPYRSIFSAIIDGIKDTLGDEVKLFSAGKDDSAKMVNEWLKTSDIEYTIALGTRSEKLTKSLNLENKLIGAITNPPLEGNFASGILFTPDPGKVLQELNKLAPDVDSIYIVYSEHDSGWYINLAKREAEKYNIKLITIKSSSFKESLSEYRKILTEKIENKCAIWLLQDQFSTDNNIILPMLLKKAWEDKFPVISNTPGHVSRGVLMALYPDHFEIGVSLASRVHNLAEGEQKISPFTDAFVAANVRTAEHLELGWTRKMIRNIDTVFPQK